MKDNHTQRRIFFYLALPIALMCIYIIAMLVYMAFPGFGKYLGYVIFLFVLAVILELYIFKTRILPYFLETDKIQKLLQAQELGARLLIRRDLELTQANEKLRELDTRKSEFLSVVAHQLRTPLSGIKWTLSMLLNGDLGVLTTDQRVFLMKGYESNQRMIALVEDMLNADRVGSGKYHYEYSSVQLLDLIDNVLYELVPLANKKNIKISYVNRHDHIPQVMIDADKVRQVVQNLMENAIKYTKKGGEIKIEPTVTADNFVQVAVSDSGIGIPEDQKKNIFNRFFRAQNAVKLETDGSGLGLYIAKGIIEKHGGNLWFSSEEGKGSTFYFTVKAG